MKVKLTIKAKALEKLRMYVEECPAEISGFGKVRDVTPKGVRGAKAFECYDVEILPQGVSGADANMSEEEIAAFLTSKIRAKQSVTDYKLWWHSHNDFGVFFSRTDTGTIESSSEFPYLISLVTNKANEYEARIDVYKPIRMTSDVEVFLESYGNQKLRDQIKKEIEEKVVIQKGWSGWGGGSGRGWGFTGWGKKHELKGADRDDDDPPLHGANDPDNPQRIGESDDEYFARLAGDYEENDDGILVKKHSRHPGRRTGRGLHTGMY